MLDVVYAQVAAGRRRWFERHPGVRRRLRAPVISVGNLSVGGTGKTPLVAMIAEWLIDRGERPAILSRGYGRTDPVDGVEVVSDAANILSTLARAGDEPLMLALMVPRAVVCVCEDRYLAGVLAERRLGATVHLLDDGFQHVQLARDFDILMTAPGEVRSGRVLPFGRLRESAAAAARADFVVVVGAERDEARQEAWELGVSAFTAARRRLLAAEISGGREAVPVGPPPSEHRVVVVAGIGQPEQFFKMVRDAGYQVARTLSFGDHHGYTRRDVAAIAAAIKAENAAVVLTTAKDAVRFSALGPLPFELRTLPLHLHLDDWAALAASLDQVLRRVREAA